MLKYRWFCFWWRYKHRYWNDCRQKHKQMEKDWHRKNL